MSCLEFRSLQGVLWVAAEGWAGPRSLGGSQGNFLTSIGHLNPLAQGHLQPLFLLSSMFLFFPCLSLGGTLSMTLVYLENPGSNPPS